MFKTFDKYEPCEDGDTSSEKQNAVDFVQTRLGFEPDERQIEVLRSGAKRGILNCTRQWGKSTIAAAKAVHRAFTQDKSLVLVASPTDRQSAEFIRKAREMVVTLGIRPRGDGITRRPCCFRMGRGLWDYRG